MLKFIEVTGKNEDEAITKGLAQLGLDRDDVSLEILERGKTGFLGIGSVPAKVKLTYEAPDEAPVVEEQPAPAPAARRRARVQDGEAAVDSQVAEGHDKEPDRRLGSQPLAV